jgi:hypothetical protein
MKALEDTLIEIFEELCGLYDPDNGTDSTKLAELLVRFDRVRSMAGPLMVTMTIAALAGPDTDEESTEAQFAAMLLLHHVWGEYGKEKYDETFRGFAERVLDSYVVEILDEEIGRSFDDGDDAEELTP